MVLIYFLNVGIILYFWEFSWLHLYSRCDSEISLMIHLSTKYKLKPICYQKHPQLSEDKNAVIINVYLQIKKKK